MRHASFIGGAIALALIHFLLSFFAASAAGMTSSQPARIATNILMFPLSLVADSIGSPTLFWILWIATSLLWGIGVGMLISRFAR